MSNVSRRTFLTGTLGGAAVLATPFASRVARAAAESGGPAGDAVAFLGTGFDPMIAHVTTGATLQFTNRAEDATEIVTAPDAPAHMRQRIAGGSQASLTFGTPGIYLLYDDRTTRFDEEVGQVVARKDTPAFPRPAYAVVVATNADGGGLEPDEPRIVIPESTMTFRPWALVVRAGTPIRFDNEDGDMHVAMPSSEPMLMPSLASAGSSKDLWLKGMNAFAPVNLPGSGGTGEITLEETGVHHYFCPVHAAYDASAHTFAPLKSYGGYPYVMDGVIVVMPA